MEESAGGSARAGAQGTEAQDLRSGDLPVAPRPPRHYAPHDPRRLRTGPMVAWARAHQVKTELLVYDDPVEGFQGYLALAGDSAPLAAGGFRVQRGLRADTIESLALDMACKERTLQLNVDGAKCGIDYDPRAPGKHDAMRRFLRFLKPYLAERLSLGPDMGTAFPEIEALAREEGIPSVKAAIGRAQGLPMDEVLHRLKLLSEPVGDLSLGERRAGHALAYATLMALQRATSGSPTCAIQGFGTLARGAALSLADAGVRVMAIADEFGSIRSGDEEGFDVHSLVAAPRATPVTDCCEEGIVGESADLLEVPVDALVLAACENGIRIEDVDRVRARSVVVGANDGLTREVEDALTERGVLVVPDFVGGAGGSAAMDALFAPRECPDPPSVMTIVELTVSAMVDEVLDTAEQRGLTPREAAYSIADNNPCRPGEVPYGLRLLRPRHER